MTYGQKTVIACLAALSFGVGAFALGFSVAGEPAPRAALTIDGEYTEGHAPEVIADALERIRQTSVDPPSEQALLRGALRGMVNVVKRAGDPYALFYSPRAYLSFQELTTGRFSGIGVWLKEKDGNLEIVSVLPDTPAQGSGLKRGDVIKTVDGNDVSGLDTDGAVNRIKGPEGTRVTVGVERDGVILEFKIARAAIELPNLKGRLVQEGLGYIRLFGFGRGAGDQLREKITSLMDRGAEGIILDMRDNGGGLFSEGIQVASTFIDDGDIVIYREQNQDDVVYEAEGEAVGDIPLVVLVNEGTASASEIVAGALQDQNRAIVVGVTTYGKGSVQEVLPLLDASALKLTTAAYLTPSGRNINGKGIEPDVEVDDRPGVQRNRALEILRGIVISTSGSQG